MNAMKLLFSVLALLVLVGALTESHQSRKTAEALKERIEEVVQLHEDLVLDVMTLPRNVNGALRCEPLATATVAITSKPEVIEEIKSSIK